MPRHALADTPRIEPRLATLRRATADFLHRIGGYVPTPPIVEVGPAVPWGHAYDAAPEAYVDTRTLFPGVIRVDTDPATLPDICDDVLHLDRHFAPASVGAVLLLHVLEHMPAFWRLPALLHTLLRPGGLVFIQTPWNFRFHGPRPDCWRISDDGYRVLFGEQFTIRALDQINPTGDPLHPLVLNIVLEKP